MAQNDANIESRIIAEVELSHAPVTGYYLACVLTTQKGVYLGHNYEYESSLSFEHAEEAALKKMLTAETSPKIQSIAMYGKGKVKKFKHYVPCPACAETLKVYTSRQTIVHLIKLKDSDNELRIKFNEIIESYKTLPYSKIDATQLQSSTILNVGDRNFISDLITLGNDKKIIFYLTGSATGRGGVSTLLLKKMNIPYKDIDLICLLNNRPVEEIERDIEEIIHKHYGSLEKVTRNVPLYQNLKGVVVKKTYYHFDADVEPFVDLTYSSKLDGSFIKGVYESRHWFHELS